MTNGVSALLPLPTVAFTGAGATFTSPRSRFVLLQTLVSIVLSYQLLFSHEVLLTSAVEARMILGLLLMVGALMVTPPRIIGASWFPGALVSADTLITTTIIYLAGNASSDLYLAYFLLLLIAASVHTLTHMLGLSIIVCIGYGVLLYEGVLETGMVSTGHLLGIPVLLVMAVFYGLAIETVFKEREQNIGLLQRIGSLKKEELALEEARDELEGRVGDLKTELAQVREELQAGVLERKGLEGQLRQAQKMEAIGRLAGVVVEHFQNLWSVIASHTEVLLTKLGQHDPLRQHAEEIFKAGDRVSAITGQLIVFSRTEDYQREVLQLNAIVAGLEQTLRGLLGPPIDLRVVLNPESGATQVDRGQLERAILHLVINAREAMPGGGTLTIETHHGVDAPSCSNQHDGAHAASFVMLTVRDTGRGMNANTQAHLFEPFFSTKDRDERTGLGLATVYSIVKQCGGHIGVKSKPGQGTLFTICLPRVKLAAESQDEAEGSDLQAKGCETVLLVEEDEILRLLSLLTLLRHQYQALAACTAVEALVVAQRYTGPIHLLVTNVLMPDLSGRELSARSRHQHPGLKTLYMSGCMNDTILESLTQGTCFLQKPFTQGVLLRKIRAVLDGD